MVDFNLADPKLAIGLQLLSNPNFGQAITQGIGISQQQQLLGEKRATRKDKEALALKKTQTKESILDAIQIAATQSADNPSATGKGFIATLNENPSIDLSLISGTELKSFEDLFDSTKMSALRANEAAKGAQSGAVTESSAIDTVVGEGRISAL